MKLSLALPVVAALALSLPCFAADAPSKGENLLQQLPLPEGQWFAIQSKQGRDEIVDWKKANDPNHARTVILRGQGGYPPDRFREINYQGGSESCSSFKGTVLDETPVNGYDRTIWVGDCVKVDGVATTTLWLFISGRDSSYYLFRQWLGTPEPNSMEQWLDYFKDIRVCDTRGRRKAPCASSQ